MDRNKKMILKKKLIKIYKIKKGQNRNRREMVFTQASFFLK